jgi:DNA-binding NtrC family response regulator
MCRILVVEPDVLLRDAIVSALERRVWVVGVADAREALHALRTSSFDVVLSEIDLGRDKPSGHRLFAEVGRRWPWIQRVLMSDAPRDDDRGVPILQKPLTAQQLAVIAGIEDELEAA